MKSNNFAITGFCFACRVVSFALFSLFVAQFPEIVLAAVAFTVANQVIN